MWQVRLKLFLYCIQSYIAFDKIIILTILILQTHEHGLSFHFLASFLIFCIQRFKIYMWWLLHGWWYRSTLFKLYIQMSLVIYCIITEVFRCKIKKKYLICTSMYWANGWSHKKPWYASVAMWVQSQDIGKVEGKFQLHKVVLIPITYQN